MSGRSAAGVKAIREALSVLLEPGSVAELRVLYTRRGTASGYFDDYEKLAAAAAQWSGAAPGVYITANPVKRELIARACNRIREHARETTSDTDVLRRRWLLADFDPTRPSGVSATDAEHEAALAGARECRDFLCDELGFPADALVHADSGNGAHLFVRIDLPNDDASRQLVNRCLQALAFRFDDEHVTVDGTVGNAARIVKVPGTLTAKGDDMPERPHRLAHILQAPAAPIPVARELLKRLAALAPKTESRNSTRARTGGDRIDPAEWISGHGIVVLRSGPWQGGRRWLLAECPFNKDHTNGSAAILQLASGALAFRCLHNGCTGRDWHALRDLLEPGRGERRRRKHTRPGSAASARPSTDEDGEHLTDLGNARRLAAAHGADLRHCAKLGGWLVWDTRRWTVDDTGEVARRAKDTVVAIYAEASGATADEDRRKALARHATLSESERRLRAMIALAESELAIAARHADFDADPWLLNVENGTLDLRTGALRPHSRSGYITKLAPVAYDPVAACPTFESFLAKILSNNAELLAFVQRAAGYSLTGDTRERVLFVLWGTGANGKTTLLEALRFVLGDYALRTPTETLMVRREGGIPNDIARLKGARLVTASEAEEGKRLAESLVKELTGSDMMVARFMRAEFFEYQPTCKIWFSTNHRPVIRGADAAIWDRLRLVPLTVRIPQNEQDPDLGRKLRAEASGILKWAVEGCRAWQRQGLGTSEAVAQATEGYRQEMDVLGGFIRDRCVEEPTATERACDLYAAYSAWCEANGEGSLSARAFGMALAGRGFESARGHGGRRLWRGIRVTQVTEGDATFGMNGSDPSHEETKQKTASPCVTRVTGADDEEEVVVP